MNISTFRIFNPFRVQDGRCILSSPEAWREPLEWNDGSLWVDDELRNVLVQPDPFAEYFWSCEADYSVSVKLSDVLADLFALIDRTPLLTFWIPTRHPERVRERWPTDSFMEGMGVKWRPRRLENVRLGLPYDASTGKDGVARSLEIEDLADLCGGCFVLREDGDVEVLNA